MFTKAIVRQPTQNFADGLTSVDLGPPDFTTALAQHDAYCKAIEQCGLELIRLPGDSRYPDATFVEDTAIVLRAGAIITTPGAPRRRGETNSIAQVLSQFFPCLEHINENNCTVDGGDVCEAGDHFFIGISERTNHGGAKRLSEILSRFGYTSSHIDIREIENILHLKSGIAYLGENRLVVIDAFAEREELSDYDLIRVPAGEEYAANCVRVNDYVLVAAGFPKLLAELQRHGLRPLALEMSEFQKMDGGLSCLSLRF
jgi:dimethylargininase